MDHAEKIKTYTQREEQAQKKREYLAANRQSKNGLYQIEACIVFLVCMTEYGPEIAAKVNPDWFFYDEWKDYFLKAKEAVEKNGILDMNLTTLIFGENTTDFILAQFNRQYTIPALWGTYVKELRRQWTWREIQKEAHKIVQNPEENRLSYIEKLIQENADIKYPEKSFSDLILEVREYCEKNQSKVINTNFPVIDSAIGGLRPGELYTIGARTGQGKTALVCKIGMNAARYGSKVLMFTTEMNALDLMTSRLLPLYTGINVFTFRNFESLKEKFPTMASRLFDETDKKLNLWVCDNPMPSIDDIKNSIERIRPDVLLVDYLQRCKTPAGENRRLQISELVVQFKVLSVEKKIPVVLAAQLNRDAARRNEAPMVSDLQETGAIEQESDAVFLLWEPPIKPGQVEDLRFRHLELYAAKNRHGKDTLAKILMDRNTTDIYQEDPYDPKPKSNFTRSDGNSSGLPGL